MLFVQDLWKTGHFFFIFFVPDTLNSKVTLAVSPLMLFERLVWILTCCCAPEKAVWSRDDLQLTDGTQCSGSTRSRGRLLRQLQLAQEQGTSLVCSIGPAGQRMSTCPPWLRFPRQPQPCLQPCQHPTGTSHHGQPCWGRGHIHSRSTKTSLESFLPHYRFGIERSWHVCNCHLEDNQLKSGVLLKKKKRPTKTPTKSF